MCWLLHIINSHWHPDWSDIGISNICANTAVVLPGWCSHTWIFTYLLCIYVFSSSYFYILQLVKTMQGIHENKCMILETPSFGSLSLSSLCKHSRFLWSFWGSLEVCECISKINYKNWMLKSFLSKLILVCRCISSSRFPAAKARTPSNVAESCIQGCNTFTGPKSHAHLTWDSWLKVCEDTNQRGDKDHDKASNLPQDSCDSLWGVFLPEYGEYSHSFNCWPIAWRLLKSWMWCIWPRAVMQQYRCGRDTCVLRFGMHKYPLPFFLTPLLAKI